MIYVVCGEARGQRINPMEDAKIGLYLSRRMQVNTVEPLDN